MTLSVMLDTNVASALMRQPRGPILQRLRHLDRDGAGVSIVTAAELRFGAFKVGRAKVSEEVENFLALIAVLPFDVPADRRYGEIRVYLESVGRPIGAHDLLIAAHALVHDLTLVTANTREFARVPNLRVENWLD
jgi:tRNA(fMet)-specific endonuclease VapC